MIILNIQHQHYAGQPSLQGLELWLSSYGTHGSEMLTNTGLGSSRSASAQWKRSDSSTIRADARRHDTGMSGLNLCLLCGLHSGMSGVDNVKYGTCPSDFRRDSRRHQHSMETMQ
jgi:hypothetical protein